MSAWCQRTNPVAIWIDQDGQRYLADGRNRLDAMAIVGIDVMDGADGYLHYETVEGDPYDYVISANIHRRHLTAEQKRDLVAKLLKMNPERSNRQTAKIVGVDDKTAGSVRRELEARSEIPHVAKTVDTKGRKQPASKPPKSKAAVEAPEPATVTGKQEKKITKVDQSRIGALLGMTETVLRGLDHFEANKPNVIALIVKVMADERDRRDDIQSLRNWLNRLLAMSNIPAESNPPTETNTKAEAEREEFKAETLRNMQRHGEAIKQKIARDADKAKAEALN